MLKRPVSDQVVEEFSRDFRRQCGLLDSAPIDVLSQWSGRAAHRTQIRGSGKGKARGMAKSRGMVIGSLIGAKWPLVSRDRSYRNIA